MGFDKITIVNVRPPSKADLNTELQWLGAALGLFGDRDKDSSCFRVFVSLVKASKRGTPITSDEIANQTSLSRATVVHHLSKLRNTGLAKHEVRGYSLTGDNIENAILRMHDDIKDALDLFSAVARDIDEKLR